MCVYKMKKAKMNLKSFRVRAYLNVIVPALIELLKRTDYKALDKATRKTLSNQLVSIYITLGWI